MSHLWIRLCREDDSSSNYAWFTSVLWCLLRFPYNNDVRFVFTSSCLFVCKLVSYLRYLCSLRIVVSNTYYVVSFVLFVFVLCFVYLMLQVSLDFPFLISPSVFSNIYLHNYYLLNVISFSFTTFNYFNIFQCSFTFHFLIFS